MTIMDFIIMQATYFWWMGLLAVPGLYFMVKDFRVSHRKYKVERINPIDIDYSI